MYGCAAVMSASATVTCTRSPPGYSVADVGITKLHAGHGMDAIETMMAFLIAMKDVTATGMGFPTGLKVATATGMAFLTDWNDAIATMTAFRIASNAATSTATAFQTDMTVTATTTVSATATTETAMAMAYTTGVTGVRTIRIAIDWFRQYKRHHDFFVVMALPIQRARTALVDVAGRPSWLVEPDPYATG